MVVAVGVSMGHLKRATSVLMTAQVLRGPEPSPTSSFLRAESFCINGLGRCLVTMCGLGPCVLRGDDLRGDREVAIDLLDVGFRCGGLADAQTGAVVGG